RAQPLSLDEPTSGLDPLMEQVFQQCVRRRRGAGGTVRLSRHILGEAEYLADRVSVIRPGRPASTGTLAALRRTRRTPVPPATRGPPEGVDETPGVADLARERVGERFDSYFTVDGEHLDAAIGVLQRARIDTLTATPPSLDSLFLRQYHDEDEPQ